MRTLHRLLLSATLVAAPLAAQTATSYPTSDPVVQRIFRLGMDSSQVQKLSQTLLDSVGPRLTASPGMKNASDWVIKKYQEWGIEGRRENYGTWRGWRRGVSHIDLMQPRVRSLEGQMLAWSPGTPGGRPVTAEAIILPRFNDSTEFVKWLPSARGKIVMISPAWLSCRPGEDWHRFATPAVMARMDSQHTRMQEDWAARIRGTGYAVSLGTGTLGERMEKAGIAGMLTSRLKINYGSLGGPGAGGGRGGGGGGRGGRGGGDGTPVPNNSARGGGPSQAIAQANAARLSAGPGGSAGQSVVEVFETYNTIAPAVTLSCEDYGLVYRLAENNQKPQVRLELDAQLLGEQPAFNTIGVIKGVEKPDEYVMLSAHFDSWDGGSGATDNGTGTMMAMEAMRILKLAYPRPKRTIMVGHWNSEEQGLNGSRAFAQDHPEILKGLQALFNQDNGTGRVQSISGNALTHAGKHLKAWYEKLPGWYSDSMSQNAVSWSFNDQPAVAAGGTDGAVFSCYATPSFGFGAVNWNYGNYTWHTNRDTYDKVVFDDLKHNATLAALMVYMASEDPQLISRERSPGTWPADWPNNCGIAPRQTRAR
jgi:carboxypeptidase Q